MDGGPRDTMRRIRRAVLLVTKRVALCIIVMVVGGVVQGLLRERVMMGTLLVVHWCLSVTQHTNRQR